VARAARFRSDEKGSPGAALMGWWQEKETQEGGGGSREHACVLRKKFYPQGDRD